MPGANIFPTSWFGARLAEVSAGDTVVVLGAGPVGVFAVVSAVLTGSIGPDRAIDAVGIDAERPLQGPGASRTQTPDEQFVSELEEVAPQAARTATSGPVASRRWRCAGRCGRSPTRT